MWRQATSLGLHSETRSSSPGRVTICHYLQEAFPDFPWRLSWPLQPVFSPFICLSRLHQSHRKPRPLQQAPRFFPSRILKVSQLQCGRCKDVFCAQNGAPEQGLAFTHGGETVAQHQGLLPWPCLLLSVTLITEAPFSYLCNKEKERKPRCQHSPSECSGGCCGSAAPRILSISRSFPHPCPTVLPSLPTPAPAVPCSTCTHPLPTLCPTVPSLPGLKELL